MQTQGGLPEIRKPGVPEQLPLLAKSPAAMLSSLFQLPYATRAILYGLVVLGAVMALRERRLQ
ncbi:MAG: hypothetical protein EOR81_05570 [Mesorhizobium sp.]|nr:MAG: hypothetical protein EOR81_05570 [Mesorhizobium sp.]